MLALFVSAGTTTAGWKEIFDKVFSMHVQDSTVTPEIVFHDTAVGMMVCNVPQELFIANGMSPHYLVADYNLSQQDVEPCALVALDTGNYKIFDDLLELYPDLIVDFSNSFSSVFNRFIEAYNFDQQELNAMKNYVKRYLFAMNKHNKWKLDDKSTENLLIKTLEDHYNNNCPTLSNKSSIHQLIDFGCNAYGYSRYEGYMFAFLRCGFPSITGKNIVWYRKWEGPIGAGYCVFLAEEPLKKFELDPANNCELVKQWKQRLIQREGKDYADEFFKAYVSYLCMRCLFQNIHKPDILADKMKALYTVLVKVLPDEVKHFMQTPQALTCFGSYSIRRVLHDYTNVLLSLVKNNAYTDLKVNFK